MNPIEAIKGIFTHDNFILNEYRIPRTLLGLIIGSSLAISGAIIQGVVRNPLASPDVIGISKGASLAAVIIIMLFPSAPLAILPIGSLLPWFIITIPIILMLSHQLDILGLGDNVAVALGAKVKRLKMVLLILSVMLAGASISVVGGISFLGLISPHIARQIVGHKTMHVAIMSGLIGAILLTFGDGLARGIHPPLDIPVGVIIAIIGAPYFLFLLRKM